MYNGTIMAWVMSYEAQKYVHTCFIQQHVISLCFHEVKYGVHRGWGHPKTAKKGPKLLLSSLQAVESLGAKSLSCKILRKSDGKCCWWSDSVSLSLSTFSSVSSLHKNSLNHSIPLPKGQWGSRAHTALSLPEAGGKMRCRASLILQASRHFLGLEVRYDCYLLCWISMDILDICHKSIAIAYWSP